MPWTTGSICTWAFFIYIFLKLQFSILCTSQLRLSTFDEINKSKFAQNWWLSHSLMMANAVHFDRPNTGFIPPNAYTVSYSIQIICNYICTSLVLENFPWYNSVQYVKPSATSQLFSKFVLLPKINLYGFSFCCSQHLIIFCPDTIISHSLILCIYVQIQYLLLTPNSPYSVQISSLS